MTLLNVSTASKKYTRIKFYFLRQKEAQFFQNFVFQSYFWNILKYVVHAVVHCSCLWCINLHCLQHITLFPLILLFYILNFSRKISLKRKTNFEVINKMAWCLLYCFPHFLSFTRFSFSLDILFIVFKFCYLLEKPTNLYLFNHEEGRGLQSVVAKVQRAPITFILFSSRLLGLNSFFI